MFLRMLVLAWSFCRWGALAVNENSTGAAWLRVVGGGGRCRGELEVQRSGQDWIGVDSWGFRLKFGHRVCAELGCGPALSVAEKNVSLRDAVAVSVLEEGCEDSSLIDCFDSDVFESEFSLELNCSDSVLLVSGRTPCSGSLQFRDQTSDQSYSWACAGALDRRGAEVVCRELGCGAPLLQGALSPLGQTFHCEGHESALMDCPRNQTRTDPGTCPPLNLTCSDLRLVGEPSRCAGAVEIKYMKKFTVDWRRVEVDDVSVPWPLEAASAVCVELGCGSAVVTRARGDLDPNDVWYMESESLKNTSVRDCVRLQYGSFSDRGVELVCSDLLNVPALSVSEGEWGGAGGGAWVQVGADFRVKCFIEPQYPGGSFQLLSPTANLTLPAVNHSASFLFTDTGPAHRGNYTCVYFLQAFNHSFSSNCSLHIHPGVSISHLLLRALVLLLLQLLNFIPYIYYKSQASRRRQRRRRATP